MVAGSHPRGGCISETGMLGLFVPLAASPEQSGPLFPFSQPLEPRPRAPAAAGDQGSGVQGQHSSSASSPRQVKGSSGYSTSRC